MLRPSSIVACLGAAVLCEAFKPPDDMIVIPLGKHPVVMPYDRLNTKAAYLDEELYWNSIDVQLGSPPQAIHPIHLTLDHHVTWFSEACVSRNINPQDRTLDGEVPWDCETGEHLYSAMRSTTSANRTDEGPMMLRSGARTDPGNSYFVKDRFLLGGAELEAAMFASPTFEMGRRHGRGFLALGPKLAGMDKPSILEQYLEAKKISSSAFSIMGGSPLVKYGDLPKNDGALILGGLDTKKYTGKLHEYKISKKTEAGGDKSRYWITLDSIKLHKAGRELASLGRDPIPAYHDPSSFFIHLPRSHMAELLDKLPGAEDRNGIMGLPCYYRDEPWGSMEFNFGELNVNMSFSDLAYPNFEHCLLPIRASEGEYAVLGNMFLGHVALTIDAENEKLYMAKRASCGTKLAKLGRDNREEWHMGGCTEDWASRNKQLRDGGDDDPKIRHARTHHQQQQMRLGPHGQQRMAIKIIE